jgi:antitoxin component YwqK of YwqJK toxin-antitoxin module
MPTKLTLLLIATAFIYAGCTTNTTKTEIKKADDADAFIMQNKTGNDTVYYDEDKKQVRFAGELIKGKRNGLWKAYYQNGTLWSEGEYVNGSGEGLSHIFYPNGSIKIMGYYTNDKPAGLWQFFDENGTMTHEIDYTQDGKGKVLPAKKTTPKK